MFNVTIDDVLVALFILFIILSLYLVIQNIVLSKAVMKVKVPKESDENEQYLMIRRASKAALAEYDNEKVFSMEKAAEKEVEQAKNSKKV
jgi:hypothetical protein